MATVKRYANIALGALACAAIGTAAAQGAQQQGAQQTQQRQTQQRQQGQPQGQQRQTQQRQQQAGAQAQEQMAQGRRVVVGEVTDIREVAITGPAADQHRLVKVMANDRTVIVDLGPVAEANLDLQEGDRIMAVGNSARIGGMPVIYARYVGELYSNVPLMESEKVAQGQGGQRAQRQN